jgi:hypothetical protein
LSKEDAAWLGPFFEEDLDRLEDLLGVSLEAWRWREDLTTPRSQG